MSAPRLMSSSPPPTASAPSSPPRTCTTPILFNLISFDALLSYPEIVEAKSKSSDCEQRMDGLGFVFGLGEDGRVGGRLRLPCFVDFHLHQTSESTNNP